MQRPTLQNVRVNTTRDALHVFAGVARNVLPLITRRLDAEERRAIEPGNIYVWEERSSNSEVTGLGMERWTDGMSWSASRVREDFLFYQQKDSPEAIPDITNPAAPWAPMMNLYPIPKPRAPTDAERLIKQTYSVRVRLPSDQAKGVTRKWHITAYFSQAKANSLRTVDSLAGVGDVPVPDGWFDTAKTTRNCRSSAPAPGNSTQPPGVVSAGTSLPPSFSTSSFSVHPPTSSFSFTSYSAQEPRAPAFAKQTSLPTSDALSDQRRISPPFRNTYRSTAPRKPSSSPPWAEEDACADYREDSPFNFHGSSSSSGRSYTLSPARGSPRPPTSPPQDHLLPLEQGPQGSYVRRDPFDEQLLNKFSIGAISSPQMTPRLGRVSPPSNPESSENRSGAAHNWHITHRAEPPFERPDARASDRDRHSPPKYR